VTTGRGEAIRNTVIFAILVNGLAWLGPVLGGNPTTPGPGFLLCGIAPIASTVVTKSFLQDRVSLGLGPAFSGNGHWCALSILAYLGALMAVVTIALVIGGGSAYLHDILFAAIEVLSILLILWLAWKRPAPASAAYPSPIRKGRRPWRP
jgi:hypothetical protein